MDFDFTSSKLAQLSTKERAAVFQKLASQAEKMGHDAIARQWRQLGAENESAAQPAQSGLIGHHR